MLLRFSFLQGILNYFEKDIVKLDHKWNAKLYTAIKQSRGFRNESFLDVLVKIQKQAIGYRTAIVFQTNKTQHGIKIKSRP